MSLRLKLKKDKRDEEARKCLERKQTLIRDTGFDRHVQRMVAWDKQWRMCMERDAADKPWPNASDYNPPLTFSKVEDIHAVLFGLLSSFDFFNLAASGGMSFGEEVMRKRSQLLSEYMKWSMQNESNSAPFLDRFTHNGVLFGHSFGILPWLQLKENIRAEVFIPDELRKVKGIKDKDLITVALGQALKDGPTRIDKDRYRIIFIDDDGMEKEGIAYVDRENPFRPDDELVLVIDREIVRYNAPRPRIKNPWDLIVPPSARDLQTARCLFDREWMTYSEIARFAKSSLFNAVSEDDLAMLRAKSEMDSRSLSSSNTADQDLVIEQHDLDLGLTLLEDRRNFFEITYEYAHEDVDGDGYTESIVRAVASSSGGKPILLMRHPIDYIYPHGRRPFFDWGLIPIPGRYYCMGVPEILEKIQVETNAYYQNRSDVIELITKPTGFYEPMSGIAPNVIKIRPGFLMKARDPQRAFAPLVFPVDPGLLLREQSITEMQAEKAVGSTEMGLGRQPGRNAPRTLGGTAILVRQQQLRMDVFANRLIYGIGEAGGGVVEFLQQYKDLLVAFTSQKKEFRALGTDEIRVIQRSDLEGRYDFVIDIGQELNNPQIRLQNATLRYQYSMQNPLVTQDPNALWKLTVDLWEATGMKNASRVLRPPQPAEAHPPMSQEEEFALLGRGIYIEPLVSDNHMEHIAAIAEMLSPINSYRLAQIFGPTEIPLLNKHAQKHMEFMQVAAQVQQQQGMGMQGGPQQRGQRVQASMGAGMPQLQEPMAGPIENEVQRGLVP
jgi:hypothetical protein